MTNLFITIADEDAEGSEDELNIKAIDKLDHYDLTRLISNFVEVVQKRNKPKEKENA